MPSDIGLQSSTITQAIHLFNLPHRHIDHSDDGDAATRPACDTRRRPPHPLAYSRAPSLWSMCRCGRLNSLRLSQQVASSSTKCRSKNMSPIITFGDMLIDDKQSIDNPPATYNGKLFKLHNNPS